MGNLHMYIWEIIGLFGTRDETALGEIGLKCGNPLCVVEEIRMGLMEFGSAPANF